MNAQTQPSFVAFLRKNRVVLFVGTLVFLFVIGYSLSTLTTKPRIWTDESVSIELAKNFADDGFLDVEFAPERHTGFSYLLQSTGYPVTVPLGVLFHLFGFSFSLARLYMLGWMLVVLVALYLVGRRFFDPQLVLFSLLLVATFASFYGSGRTVVGEIPGFFFLLIGLYFLFEKKSCAVAGIFLGLAVVTKPSVFGLLLPVLFIVLLLRPRRFFPRFVQLAVGMLPAALLWFPFVGVNPFAPQFFHTISSFYQNPYGSDISTNVIQNVSGFFSSTTLLYFFVLFLLVVVARFLSRRAQIASLYDFVIIYSVIAFAYYLRSPGWLRYILIAELLILFVLPHAIFITTHFFQKKVKVLGRVRVASLTAGILLVFSVVQVVQLIYFSDIYTSSDAIKTAQILDNRFVGKRVAIINNADLYVLVKNPQREGLIEIVGIPQIGINPLLGNILPDVAVFIGRSDKFRTEAKTVLDTHYAFEEQLHGYDIFTLRDE